MFERPSERKLFLYQSFGLVFSSELELYGVAEADPQSVPLLRVRLGDVPDRLSEAADQGELHGIRYEAKPGEILLSVAGVGKYLIRRGSDIVVEQEPSVSLDRTRVYLMGSAFGALLQQRGMMPLHASAIRVGEGCVAFTGASGAGKSTLAAFCGKLGYDVICDDMCPLAIAPGQGPVVWPGFPRVKIWIDALASLGVSPDGIPRVVNKCDKFELPTRYQPERPLPLRRLYVLERSSDPSNDQVDIEQLDDSRSLESLLNNTYRYEFLKGLGLRERHFHTCVEALSDLAVLRLSRPWDLSQLDRTAELLDDELAQVAAQSR